MKQLIPSPFKRLYRRAHNARAFAVHQLDLLLDRALPAALRRRRKESWEFEWQRDNWAELYKDPQIKERAREYWRSSAT